LKIISINKQRKVTILRFECTKSKELDMNATKNILALIVLLAAAGLFACNKSGNGTTDPGPFKLSYGDSIIYLKPAAGDYIVYPSIHKDGVYSGFPEGIEIDDISGAINISKSETGLRYKITHTATDGTVTTAMIVLSGITYRDHFFNLAQNDSMAMPVYNSSESRPLPLNGSSFDEGNNANSGGCSVRTDNAIINLAQCVRNGVFGNTPQNDSRREFDIQYRINDGSGKSLNKLRVRLYYYTSMATVAPDLLQTLQDRQTDGVFLRGGTVETSQVLAKPRPPCIIIVGQ
jgi:hypothetical protein